MPEEKLVAEGHSGASQPDKQESGSTGPGDVLDAPMDMDEEPKTEVLEDSPEAWEWKLGEQSVSIPRDALDRAG